MRATIGEIFDRHGLPGSIVPDYWAMLTLSLILGTMLALALLRRSGFDLGQASDLLFWGIPSLLLGAKGFYVLKFLDGVAPALAAGLCLGRVGCFLAGCNGGVPSNLPWAVRFPRSTPVYVDQTEAGLIEGWETWSLPAHPTQLYESLFGLVAFGLLVVLLRQKKWHGQIFHSGVVWYSVFRFCTEPLRADAGSLRPFGLLTFAQFVSVLVVVSALSVWLSVVPARQKS